MEETMRSMLRLLASGWLLASLLGPSSAFACPDTVPCRERLADPVRKPVVEAEPAGPTRGEMLDQAARDLSAAVGEASDRWIALEAVVDGEYPTPEAKAEAEAEARLAYVAAKAASKAAFDKYIAMMRPPSTDPTPVEPVIEVSTATTTTAVTTVTLSVDVLPAEPAPPIPPEERIKWVFKPGAPISVGTVPPESAPKSDLQHLLEAPDIPLEFYLNPGRTLQPLEWQDDERDVPWLRTVPSDRSDLGPE